MGEVKEASKGKPKTKPTLSAEEADFRTTLRYGTILLAVIGGFMGGALIEGSGLRKQARVAACAPEQVDMRSDECWCVRSDDLRERVKTQLDRGWEIQTR